MSDTTNLEIVTPSMVLVSEPVDMVVIPGSDGQIGALPRHSKVMSINKGETRIMIPSPKVSTYDLQPEMSAPEVTDRLIAAIRSNKFDVIICNLLYLDFEKFKLDFLIIINNCNYLNNQSAAALLKTLEETNTKSIFLRRYSNNFPAHIV